MAKSSKNVSDLTTSFRKMQKILDIQSNSIIVDSIIVENSKIVDDLAATKDFYLIKIHNSRNSKIVELFFGEVARNLVFYQLFLP